MVVMLLIVVENIYLDYWRRIAHDFLADYACFIVVSVVNDFIAFLLQIVKAVGARSVRDDIISQLSFVRPWQVVRYAIDEWGFFVF